MTKKIESARDIFRESARETRKVPVTITKKVPMTKIVTCTLPVTKNVTGKKKNTVYGVGIEINGKKIRGVLIKS